MSSRGAEPHDREPARQPTLAAYAPEPVLPPTASAPDWRSRQGRWVDRSLSGRHHLPCCRGLFRPVAKSNPCTIPRSKRQRPSYRSRPHTPNLWTVPLNCAWRWQFGDDCSDGFLHLLPKVESQRSISDSQIRRLKLGDFRKYDVLSQITSSWLKH